MNLNNTSVAPAGARRWSWINFVAALFLFFGTALVVAWQNSRLAVLWDLSYTLENSYRISLGDIPYRDFPFAHAPLTFLIQAAIIKLTGRVFWHHAAYCAIVGGLSIVLTWRIMETVLRGAVTHFRLLAFLLALPLIPLGIYSVFPHPFYDPDCTFAILLGVFLLQRLDLKPASATRALLAGFALVIPLFVKQNTGLAFLCAAAFLLVAIIVIEGLPSRLSRGYLLALAGALMGLVVALLLIQFKAGLKPYWRWTIRFAAERRTPALNEMLGVYAGKAILLWLAFIAVGVICFWLSRSSRSDTGSACQKPDRQGGQPAEALPMNKSAANGSSDDDSRRTRESPLLTRGLLTLPQHALALLSAFLIAAPFVWPTIYLLREPDSSERADRLLAVWPVLLIFSFLVAIVTIKKRRGVSRVMPFIIIAAIHGAFMSQQLWGSTYAIWPLFTILLAMTIASLAAFNVESEAELHPRKTDPRLDAGHLPQTSSPRLDAGLVPQTTGQTSPPSKRTKEDFCAWFTIPLTVTVSLSLLVSGGFYVRSHERLDYANLDEGDLRRSTLPQLKGLSVRGDWIPNFEELIAYTDREIPRDEGILILPGEDPFYYATGRRPRFPVLLFDHTVNPYSPEEILRLARERNIRWLIIKQDLQDEDEQVEQERDRITEVLEQDFEQVESLGNYDIYRRKDPNAESDDDDTNPN